MVNSSLAAKKSLKRGAVKRKLDALKDEWKAFAKSPPGKRFEQRYERKHDAGRPAWQRFVSFAIGLVIAAVGLIMLPAPGPGIPVALVGLGLMAEHLRFVAKLLDRCEPPLRAAIFATLLWWKNRSTWQRVLLGFVVGLLLLAMVALLFTWSA